MILLPSGSERVRTGNLAFAFWEILQESRGHASCGFQLHCWKQPPKCRVVYCVSAGRISPHQSSSASAGWASEGSARSASRRLSTAEIMRCREKRSICMSIYRPIRAPAIWQTSAEEVVLSAFSPVWCRACFHPPQRAGPVSEGISMCLSVVSALLFVKPLSHFSRELRGLCAPG